MSALGHVIVELSVRSHFGAPLPAGPVLGGAQQRGTISLAPEIFSDVPPFDVAHRLRRIAVIGVRAQAHFEETDQRPARNLGDENRGSAPQKVPANIAINSCACSSAEDSGHNAARRRASGSRSEGWASLTRAPLTPRFWWPAKLPFATACRGEARPP